MPHTHSVMLDTFVRSIGPIATNDWINLVMPRMIADGTSKVRQAGSIP